MILLFGSGGFIGRHVREGLGGDVVEASRERIDLTTASHDDLTGLLYEVAPEAIVNCAGATTGDAHTLTRTNVAGVARLLCAVTTASPKARFVHVGCAAEYGGTPMGSPIGEETECRPAGDYGVTKLAATELVRAAAADGLDAVVLRVFSVIGAGAPPKSLPMRLARRLREDGDLVVGGLEVYRDFVDVRDVARAVALAVQASGALPPVVNVGSGRATAVRDLITTLVEIARPGTRVVPGAIRTPTIPWQAADITRAEESLAWRPEIPLRATLETLWTTTQEQTPPTGTSPATREATQGPMPGTTTHAPTAETQGPMPGTAAHAPTAETQGPMPGTAAHAPTAETQGVMPEPARDGAAADVADTASGSAWTPSAAYGTAGETRGAVSERGHDTRGAVSERGHEARGGAGPEAVDGGTGSAWMPSGAQGGAPEHGRDVRGWVMHEVADGSAWVPGAVGEAQGGMPQRGEAVAMQGWPLSLAAGDASGGRAQAEPGEGAWRQEVTVEPGQAGAVEAGRGQGEGRRSLAWYVGSGQVHGASEVEAANAPTAPWHMRGTTTPDAPDASGVTWPGEWRPTGTGGGTT
ncbi:NAD-dependent epimerase/dehydratase family protein [Nonomuraea sediminis]|uniref:NAD-dependent epimerase/dehydratase family protein n=1 Tax=Nonomuraea sediminis TaxID=2835864 RepID=UPI001BDBCB3F|nr:NAD-dependent epimerase/dehydratase family protein [Nonomuraea sediminis]